MTFTGFPSLEEGVITEGSLVGQAWLFLDKSTPVVFIQLQVLHKPRNSFYENLLHNIPRDRGELHWSLVPCIPFLVVMFCFFFLNNSNACLFPVIRFIHENPRPFIADKNHSQWHLPAHCSPSDVRCLVPWTCTCNLPKQQWAISLHRKKK